MVHNKEHGPFVRGISRSWVRAPHRNRLHHCAYYDALIAARIATSLGYVMAAMFPPSNRSVVTHSRQMVGKVRWWRHVRAEWVAAATNTAWERWKATY